MADPNTTETGINIATYVADRDSGLCALIKPVKGSGNYVYMRTTHSVAMVNGVATVVEGTPELRNVNRQSLLDFSAQLNVQEAQIAQLRAQAAAMMADMDKLDAA